LRKKYYETSINEFEDFTVFFNFIKLKCLRLWHFDFSFVQHLQILLLLGFKSADGSAFFLSLNDFIHPFFLSISIIIIT